MRSVASAAVVRGSVLLLGLIALAAGDVSAQMVFDGNLLFNNNASGTLGGQATGTAGAGAPACAPGTTGAQLVTVTYTHNLYSDPLLPNAPYKPNTLPNFKPAAGSPAVNGAVRVPNDGFFEQTCYRGAIDPSGTDWTQGWTYWDSSGAGRQDLHLAGMPDPRPLATYANINIYGHPFWSPDSNYLVRGQLRVKSQASLSIPPGVVVFEEFATLGTIVVERGGKLYAIGTACDPIIVTSDDAPGSFARGHCGGIVLNGRARVNVVNSCAGDSSASEGGAAGFYGGNDDNDNSGTLRYVRVEFAGKEITPNNELNSFTWNACGRNTHADYLQAYAGADDSFEWFGGAMDVKHLIGTDGTDDGYDWQLGTRNRAQFVILRPAPNFAPSGTQNGDKGIEADNNEFNFDQTQCAGRSNTLLANFTIIGDKRVGAAFPGPVSGVNWRRGTASQMLNSIIANFKTSALKIDDDATWQAHCSALPAAPPEFCPVVGVNTVADGNMFVAQSWPNPVRREMTLSFNLPKASPVTVEIYSADGRLIKTLAQGRMEAGPHELAWSIDRETPTGVYFYRVNAGAQGSSGKIVRIAD